MNEAARRVAAAAAGRAAHVGSHAVREARGAGGARGVSGALATDLAYKGYWQSGYVPDS